MMACSRKEADEIVDLLLKKDADVNMKSTPPIPPLSHPMPSSLLAQTADMT